MRSATERQQDVGLLVMRLAMAGTLLFYTLPKLFGGSFWWAKAGQDLKFLHAGVSVQVVGLVLLILYSLGGLSLITGFLFRISAVVLAVLYSLSVFSFLSLGYKTLPLYGAALAAVCLGFLFTGPGRFVVAVKIEKK